MAEVVLKHYLKTTQLKKYLIYRTTARRLLLWLIGWQDLSIF